MTEPTVMVIQMGARRNYIYAEQLECAGMLHSLVTDLAWSPSDDLGMGQFLARLSPRLRGAVARRTVRHIPSAKLKTSILPNLARFALAWQPPEQRFRAADCALAIASRARGLRGAKVIVNYLGNGGSFLEQAKHQGVKIATDFIITPRQYEIEHEEVASWPGWEADHTAVSIRRKYLEKMEWLIRISDVYLCPSQTVVRDLESIAGFDPRKVRFTPYGVSNVLLYTAEVQQGRVLYAGAAILRKGIPYLANAALQLSRLDKAIQVVVAGHAPRQLADREETKHLHFRGVLSRDQMAREFAQADVFCLPSLAEGSATSIFEALANGVPVVTTASSGSAVSNGVEGFIVPERDPDAIAAAIRRIVGDRGLRQRMSDAARATAARYGDAACGAEFIRVIRELQEN